MESFFTQVMVRPRRVLRSTAPMQSAKPPAITGDVPRAATLPRSRISTAFGDKDGSGRAEDGATEVGAAPGPSGYRVDVGERFLR